MKAYEVDAEGSSVIVFSNHSATARQTGAIALDVEFEDVQSCCRKRQYDKYAEQGYVPPLVLIDDGWRFVCLECEREVHSDMACDIDDEELNPEDFEPREYGKDNVFCSAECERAFHERARLNADAKEELRKTFEQKFPDATITFLHVCGTKLEPHIAGEAYNCSVKFTFPGSQGLECTWVYDEEECLVPNICADAFNDWREKR